MTCEAWGLHPLASLRAASQAQGTDGGSAVPQMEGARQPQLVAALVVGWVAAAL